MVSVIITTKNSELYIASCIQSIKDSTYKNIEIIVVDNYSDDLTFKIAKAHGVDVYLKGNERSEQRNYGVMKATGKYVLILDVDMTIHPELIAECIDRAKCRDAFYVPEKIIGSGFWVKVRDHERSFYNGTRIDAIRFVRKSRWIDYDVDLCGAEDWDHDRRFRGTKGITKNPLYHNEDAFSFTKYIGKKGYYAQWMNVYKAKHGDCPELSIRYRYFKVFVEDGKWRKLLRRPFLSLAMFFVVVLKGLVYICAKKY